MTELTGGLAKAGSTLLGWLEEVQVLGVKLGIERARASFELVGNPQRGWPTLLIGGTNGKGSTTTYATRLLMGAGHRVGSTLSPHLSEYRERFRIDGVPIAQDELEAIGEGLAGQVRGKPGMAELTFFELGALIAAQAFAAARVDAAVVEVGMGGEFDATRAFEPKVLGLVSVDLDHEVFLGRDVGTIARTKARAAEPGGIVVTTEIRPDRLGPIAEEVAAAGAELWVAGEHFSYSWDGTLTFEGPGLRLDQAELGMPGAHQAQNAACALASVLAFCLRAGLTPPSPWEAGSALRDSRLPGRLERVRSGPGGPAFLLDGAHNPAGAQVLADALVERRRPARRVWLLAAMADKDVEGTLDALLPHVDEVVCTSGTSTPRFAERERLAAVVRGCTALPVTTAVDPNCAVAELRERLSSRDEVLVAGSLYLVGEVRDALGKPIG